MSEFHHSFKNLARKKSDFVQEAQKFSFPSLVFESEGVIGKVAGVASELRAADTVEVQAKGEKNVPNFVSSCQDCGAAF